MSQPYAELPWVYDPGTKHVYRGVAFDGLEVLDVDDAGQPILPTAVKAAITKAENKESAK